MKRCPLLLVAAGVLVACCQADTPAPPLQVSYDFARGEALTYVRPATWRDGPLWGGRWRVAPAVGTSLVDGRPLGGVVAGWAYEWRDRSTGVAAFAGVEAYAFARPGQAGGGFGLLAVLGVRF